MKKAIQIASVVAFLCSAYYAHAQTCSSYIGKRIEMKGFDAVAKMLPKAPDKKGEFETTAEYEERVAAARSSAPGGIIIDLGNVDSGLKYDADLQKINISPFAFGSWDGIINEWTGLRALQFALYGVADVGNNNIGILVDRTSETTGSYPASNAFGSVVNVTTETRRFKGVFERKASRYDEGLLVGHTKRFGDPWQPIGSIPLSVEDAKRLKKSAIAAILVAPKSPYFVMGTSYKFETFSSPYRLNYETSAIIADIQCAFLLDNGVNRKVVAAFAVR